jgi:hypothetical protein
MIYKYNKKVEVEVCEYIFNKKVEVCEYIL